MAARPADQVREEASETRAAISARGYEAVTDFCFGTRRSYTPFSCEQRPFRGHGGREEGGAIVTCPKPR